MVLGSQVGSYHHWLVVRDDGAPGDARSEGFGPPTFRSVATGTLLPALTVMQGGRMSWRLLYLDAVRGDQQIIWMQPSS